MTGVGDKRPVLGVRHGRPPDPEAGTGDAAARGLVRVRRVLGGRVAAHREPPGRNLPPVDPGCRRSGQRGITGKTMWEGCSASA